MEEKATVKFKKDEYKMRELIKKEIGKGKVSRVKIEYAPVGEKIIVSTAKPGMIIGRGGEKIEELTKILKKEFKLENPHIEIEEIKNPDLDPQIIADELALGLEKMGSLKFKILAYKSLQRIMKAGALGAEIRLGGKLPSARAKMWRFAQGYLKKTGDSTNLVNVADAISFTKPGVVGVRVSILPGDAVMVDRIKVDDKLLAKVRENREKMLTKYGKGTKKKTLKKEKTEI